MILVSVQLKNPTGQTLDSLNYLDSCNQAELNDGGGRASYFVLLHTFTSSLDTLVLQMLFIMEWGAVHIAAGF